jgi:predicted metal-dependent phosphoesterase TrpH
MVDRQEAIREHAAEQQEQLTPAEDQAIDAQGAVLSTAEQPGPGLIKVDLHCHSEASADCVTPIPLIPARCIEREVRVQAITDHNEIWGAQQLQKLVQDEGLPLTIIVGEEVSTSEGEIVGLFLHEKIEAGLSPEETVAQILAQGGLVLLPHGFDPLKRFRLSEAARARIAGDIDIVETFNARISRPTWNRVAVAWAEEHGKLMSAGSDSHTLADIGEAWVEVPRQPITTPEELLRALQGGVPVGEWTHPVKAYGYKLWDRARRRWRVLRGRLR